MTDSPNRVLVPMTVEALPVNNFGNYSDSDPHWADLTPGYYKVLNANVLGKQIVPAPFQRASNPSPGMHLHWALPDGLTHGIPPQARAVATINGGKVSAVEVLTPGSGYGFSADGPEVTLIGGGGTEATATAVMRYQVTAITVTTGGSGYTSAPSVSINGGGGTGATATAQVLNGKVIAVTIDDEGLNYTSAPTIAFTGGGGSGALAVAEIGNGHVQSIKVDNGGSSYTAAPVVNVAPSQSVQYPTVPNRWFILRIYSDTQQPATTHVAAWMVLSDTVMDSDQAGGTDRTSWPAGHGQWSDTTKFIGQSMPYAKWGGLATATAKLSGGKVSEVEVTNPGSGYNPPPDVVFTGGGGLGATATAQASAGNVSAVDLTSGGSGYTGAPTVAFSGGGGNGTKATATTDGNTVTKVTITDGGSGYVSAPTVSFNGGGGQGAKGTTVISSGEITSIHVTNGGSGYTSPPTVSLRPELSLTAVGPGDPVFAAYYPNCESVFGFYDDMADLNDIAEAAAAGIDVTYMVAGWYSSSQDDPLYAMDSPAAWVKRMTQLKWSMTPPYPLGAVDVAAKSFIIKGLGDLSTQFPNNEAFQVVGSTHNDADYTVVSTKYTAADQNNEVVSVQVTDGGSGYTSLPEVEFSDGGGTGASALATVSGGVVTAIDVINGGSGYASAPTVTLKGGGGSGAKATATINSLGSEFAITINSAPVSVADGAVAPPNTVYPTETLCQGLVYQVNWKGPSKAVDPGIPTGNPDVAVGNSSIEALSALIANKVGAQDEDVAKTLEAFQYHLLDEFDPPNGIVEVEEEVHSHAFGRLQGGAWWEIRQKPKSQSPPPQSDAGDDNQIGLPDPYGPLLGQLNLQQQKVDGTLRDMTSWQRQTYFAWYERTLSELNSISPSPGDLPPVDQMTKLTQTLIGQVGTSNEQLTSELVELNRLHTELSGMLTKDLELKSVGMPRFWESNDPALLLAGDAVGRSFKHGEDGRFTGNDMLECRISGQTITGLQVTPPSLSLVTVAEASLKTFYGSFPQGQPIPADVELLFIETMLLDTTQAPLIAEAAYKMDGKTPTPQEIQDLAATIQKQQTAPYNAALHPQLRAQVENAATALATASGFVGTVPSKVAVAHWAWPWTPLYFQWQARWYPSYNASDTGQTNWDLFKDWQLKPGQDSETEIDYTWISSDSPTQNESVFLSGSLLVTPQVAVNFADRLNQYLETLPSSNPYYKVLSDAAAQFANLNVLSQSLSGLNARLMMNLKSLQLPLISLGMESDDEEIAAQVTAVMNRQDSVAPSLGLQDARTSVETYFPIRAGHTVITQLWLTDGFGQIKTIEPSSPILAESVKTPVAGNESVIQLPPRITQPARLAFRLMSATDPDNTIQSNTESSTSPICGWILPNHLDNSLMLYSATGDALGELELLGGAFDSTQGGVRWAGVPGIGAASVGAPPDFKNTHLQQFVETLITQSVGAKSNAPLADFIKVVDETLWMVDPLGARTGQSLSVLIGRPLALVRVSLKLQLDGLPIWDQSWDQVKEVIQHLPGLKYSDHGFTNIKFPVRLGDIRNMADGLIGFFVGDDYSLFHAVHQPASGTTSDYIDYDVVVDLDCNPATPALLLTLVVDPRAAVHATSGLLPVKSIEVPPSLVSKALAAIDVTFITGPILSQTDRLRVPLPAFQAGKWSWVDQPDVTVWSEDDQIATTNDKAVLSDDPQHVFEGWLKLSGALGQDDKNQE